MKRNDKTRDQRRKFNALVKIRIAALLITLILASPLITIVFIWDCFLSERDDDFWAMDLIEWIAKRFGF